MSAIAGRVLLIPKGAYNALTTYNPLDFVTYGANSYVCKQTSTGNAPTNTTYWQLMAQGATNADNISYDGTASGLGSTDVQGAIDEVVSDTNDAISAISDVISKNGAKNYLPNNYPTQAISGLTITHNSDNTLSISGNASTSVDETISSFKLQAGTYKLSGCPANGGAGKYILYLWYEAPSTTFVRDSGDGETFTLTSETTITVKFVVYASYGNGLVFKPMLTLASQPDSDYAHYVPYAMTNRELTEKVDALTIHKGDTLTFAGEVNGFLGIYTPSGKIRTYIKPARPLGVDISSASLSILYYLEIWGGGVDFAIHGSVTSANITLNGDNGFIVDFIGDFSAYNFSVNTNYAVIIQAVFAFS